MWRNFTDITLKVLVGLSLIISGCTSKKKIEIVPSIPTAKHIWIEEFPHYSNTISKMIEEDGKEVLFTRNTLTNGNLFEVSCLNHLQNENWVVKLSDQKETLDSINLNSLIDGRNIDDDGMLKFKYYEESNSFLIYLAAEYYIDVYPDSIIVSEIEGIP
ncbi:hypothetical protein [Reichenbachiella versicolor]|uniref:hypothetical protein n=1 Tax=Reichenbachiella versicolor TaxID=1821036 RepID=UPI001C86FBE5|nr:hypothetical protein [Reichenbachiella versicolor]